MQVKGGVKKIRFRSEETGWSVFTLSTSDGDLTCVGTFLSLVEGEEWKLDGELVFHPRYGQQFTVSRAEKLPPTSLDQIRRYLESSNVPYIGPKLADRLVKKYGEGTLEVISSDPEALLALPGIGEKKAQAIREAIQGQKDMREVILYLQTLEVGPKTAQAIYRQYQERTAEVIDANPYQLIEDIPGIGFATADRIARKKGVARDSFFRTKAGLLYLFRQTLDLEGSCYLERGELEKRLGHLLQSEPIDLDRALNELAMGGFLRADSVHDRWYLSSADEKERAIAMKLVTLSEEETPPLEVDAGAIGEAVRLPLSEEQLEAVRLAAHEKVLVITGGPGTGKTTLLRAILALFDHNQLACQLAAPTGRAAKRMEQSTGRPALTVHRLLGYRGGEEGHSLPEYHAENPLDCQAVIVDEASMMDLFLMACLMDALPDSARLILLGDVDQLPSVGPGNVLSDIIQSGQLKTIRLNKIYRQSAESYIVTNAHRINAGQEPILNGEGSDFFFLSSQDSFQAADLVEDLISRRLPDHYGFDPMKDIQLLCPMKKGPCGVEVMNGRLQRALNPPGEDLPSLSVHGQLFQAGDKLMQLKNDYQLSWVSDPALLDWPRELAGETPHPADLGGEGRGEGVYNGDNGFIVDIDPEEERMVVNFEGRYVLYEREQLDELNHSYAITIHKSQGSEFPCVVIPLLPGPPMLLTRNLLYTAVTRARKICVLVGSPSVLSAMIRNKRVKERNSSLDERIKEGYKDYLALYGG